MFCDNFCEGQTDRLGIQIRSGSRFHSLFYSHEYIRMIVRSCHGSIVNGSVYDSRFRFLLGLCRARHARVGCGSEIRTRPKTTGNDERERAGKRPGTEFFLLFLWRFLSLLLLLLFRVAVFSLGIPSLHTTGRTGTAGDRQRTTLWDSRGFDNTCVPLTFIVLHTNQADTHIDTQQEEH